MLAKSYGPDWRERATRPPHDPDIDKRGAAHARELLKPPTDDEIPF
jgi:hypothetical protein